MPNAEVVLQRRHRSRTRARDTSFDDAFSRLCVEKIRPLTNRPCLSSVTSSTAAMPPLPADVEPAVGREVAEQ